MTFPGFDRTTTSLLCNYGELCVEKFVGKNKVIHFRMKLVQNMWNVEKMKGCEYFPDALYLFMECNF